MSQLSLPRVGPPPRRVPPGHYYHPGYVTPEERAAIVAWLATLHPIWEDRYAEHHPPPPGQQNRRLLRPVYWLGNWQFACLDYYRPPHGVEGRCVRAEPFPPELRRIVRRVEELVHARYHGPDLPEAWHLNTCLVNFYGARRVGERWEDTARVGEHRDFEPGPVASVSLGERALIQFVTSRRPGPGSRVVVEQWLDDRSLQLFGGAFFKDRTFHRVQRVDTRQGHDFPPAIPDFRTRRVNFTFRYVPDHHVIPFARLPPGSRDDVRPYMIELAAASPFFAAELQRERARPAPPPLA
ncbi:MAG TPA: alpha-ketoglutarate-dependent dioxygenase AlkB [Nannocystaceae bacterium]|nr:alpha-ketoglutarate-dependent dioxygenase AlkB [Nannocystaceae bacterium]